VGRKPTAACLSLKLVMSTAHSFCLHDKAQC
jgi:hypothetical protein